MRPIFLLSCLLAALPAWSQTAPTRIVSMNLCSDLLLLPLVPRERIASLSSLAANPAYSPLAASASEIPANRAQADEVLQFQPDLVLASIFSAGQTVALLQRLGYRVERLPIPTSLEEVLAVMNLVGTLTDSQALAAQLVEELQHDIEIVRSRFAPITAGKTAVFFNSNGYSYGTGTLHDDFITSLGMHNLASDAGLTGPAQLPMERLVAGQPDYIFMNSPRATDQQMALPLSQHPALGKLLRHSRVINLEDAWFDCGNASILQAYRALASALVTMDMGL
jgi:iron complex transport system substrate-binding protein